MAEFTVEIVRISEPVEHHPNADRLSLVKVGGYTCISAKLEDGSHRYKQGDLVAYIPEAAVLPVWLLKRMGFWDESRGCGTLSGSQKNRVKAIRLRGIFSQGILHPIEQEWTRDPHIESLPYEIAGIRGENDVYEPVWCGDDVAGFLGITKYEPKLPQNMTGVMGALYNVTLKYDFDSVQKKTALFEPGEDVVAHEKIHGTNIQIGYVPGLYPEENDLYVTSKGLGARGFNLKNTPENAGNLYVGVLNRLIEQGVTERMKLLSHIHGGKPVRLFGEVFGQGIQDLGYGQATPRLMIFDILVGTEYLLPAVLKDTCRMLGVEMVPELYAGPYHPERLIQVRDGKTTIGGGGHIREGIVIKAVTNDFNPRHGRKIAKWVSPDYLLRKGEVTEFA